METAHAKVGRNDPCPCGGGRKYKHCCLKAAAALEETPWKLQQRAHDRLTTDMLKLARRQFEEELVLAWADFNQIPLPKPMDDDGMEAQIFFPYFLFDWDPEPPVRRRGVKRPGVVATAYLERMGDRLDEWEAAVLHEALTQPLSFYEVVQCQPGHGMLVRDVLIGGETEVEEHKGSQMLRPGDIAYGQLSRLPGLNTFSRLAPLPIPPRKKAEIVELRTMLRRKISRRTRSLGAADLVRYEEEIREVYLDIRDTLRMPPVLQNTDGDPLVFHTVTYRVGSAQVAFDALAPLAWGITKEELLETADVDKDGVVTGFEIEWAKAGNKKFKTWDNTILGRLKISGRSLVATVNSKQRAAKIREEIERRLGILAVHQSTVAETPEDLLKDRKLTKERRKAAEERELDLSPELRAEVQAQMQRQVESWVHEEIPALGGRTPLEAVRDPDGREIVESLLLDMERGFTRATYGADVRPHIGALRRLLGMGQHLELAAAGDGAAAVPDVSR